MNGDLLVHGAGDSGPATRLSLITALQAAPDWIDPETGAPLL